MQNTPDDGGPAFPSPTGNHDQHGRLSIRDYFASDAMVALIVQVPIKHDGRTPDGVAALAYRMADAMLRARTAKSPADVQRAHLETFGK